MRAVGVRSIHSVRREIVAAGVGGDQRPEIVFDEPARQIPDRAGAYAVRAVERDRRETADVLQARTEDARGVEFEHDVAQENPIEIAFEDRRRPVVPNRKHEDQRLRRQQAIDVTLYPGAIGRRVEIAPKSLAR